MMKLPEIICTVGPSSLSERTLLGLKTAGVDIFRINMSHADLDEIYKLNELAKKLDFKLGIDTEGAQIRTKISKDQSKEITLSEGDKFEINITSKKYAKNELIKFYPETVYERLEKDMLIRLDFNGAVVLVKEKSKSKIFFECINGGVIGNNKGVDTINNQIELPDFTAKDLKSLNIAKSLGINEIFISFCKSTDSIDLVKSINKNSRVTSKIESKLSIHNLDSICRESDAILIDRGDLTREISIMDIPFAQRSIIKVAINNSTPCYIATNVLDSLIKGDIPTRAELNDIVGTLEMGATGIVLAAETAIGRKPILCAEIVKELIHRYKLNKAGLLFTDLDRKEITDEKMKVWLNRNNK